jgi:uncharacterized membrane protein
MSTGRWVLIALATVILVIAVALILQGSAYMWFTAAAMIILIFTTLRGGQKAKNQDRR